MINNINWEIIQISSTKTKQNLVYLIGFDRFSKVVILVEFYSFSLNILPVLTITFTFSDLSFQHENYIKSLETCTVSDSEQTVVNFLTQMSIEYHKRLILLK